MIDLKRVEVLAAEWGFGGHVGAPATRHEEREMAREILRLRALIQRFVDEVRRDVVPEPPAGTCIPIDPSKGEWRCRCQPNPEFDTSANPQYFSACARCGTKRPVPYIGEGEKR